MADRTPSVLEIGKYTLIYPPKIVRAKKVSSDDAELLMEYDKIGGAIMKGGEKLELHTFWHKDVKKREANLDALKKELGLTKEEPKEEPKSKPKSNKK